MTKTSHPPTLRELVQGLSAVAAHLGPKDAAQVARALSQAMTKITDARDLHALYELSQGLMAVAARLEPQGAARHRVQVASTVTRAMIKTPDPFTLNRLAQVLSAASVSLAPEEAAQQWAQAASALSQAMTKTSDPRTLRELAQGLSTVAARLGPKEARQHCARAASTLASTLTLALTKRFPMPTPPDALRDLAQGLSAVAAHLEPQEAAQAASALTLTLAIGGHGYPLRDLRELAQALSATLTRDPRSLPVRAAGLVASVGANCHQPLLAPTALLPSQAALPCRLSTQDLTDLLKHPFCVDQARRVVLEQLERRYHRTFADHWEFVRFAQQQNLGLDFATPPQRPEALLPEPRK
jgi:hypothetical protein